MNGFFTKVFALRPGEAKKVFKLAFLGLLWSFVATTGLKFADSLFLTYVGAEELPTVYQGVSVGMIALSVILLYVFHHICSYKILRFFLFSGIVFYILAHLYLLGFTTENSNGIWYALRIFGNLYMTVLMTSYWTFIDQYMDKDDAKRLFGLFSSMVFMGMLLTGAVMGSGLITLNTLFPLQIAVLSLAIFWARLIHRDLRPDHEEASAHPEEYREKSSIPALMKIIFSSSYSLLIIVGNFLTFLLWVITEFNYMTAFNEKFPRIDQQEELAQFLGHWIMIVAICNLIFGLFVYGRLVKRFGVGTILLYTPILFCLTFTGWMLNTSLIFPLMGFFIVEGSLYIIDDSNFSLLLKSGPSPIKSKLRVLIESFFEPAGMLASGYLLALSGTNSKMIGLVLAGCLAAVALTMRRVHFSNKVAA